MTTITPIPDDLGNQSLKSDNQQTPTAAAVSAVAPKRAIHNLSGSARMGQRDNVQRRSKDRRRHEERRQKNIPVLLDTRSQRERRKKQRRQDAATKLQHSRIGKGIDIKV